MRWINIGLVIAIILTYLIPGVFHWRSIKILWFFFGVIFLIFLSPTYVIIFGIFAAANIHDVSWGSWPTTGNTQLSKLEATKKENYENNWANYFFVWALINVAVGWGLSFIFRNNSKFGIKDPKITNPTTWELLGPKGFLILLTLFIGGVQIFKLFSGIFGWCWSSLIAKHVNRY